MVHSHDPNLRGAPSGFVLPIREVRASIGAGFIIPICGSMMTVTFNIGMRTLSYLALICVYVTV